MHILFERTGGFAGLKLKASLDAESLPPQQARRLRKLLQQSRFFKLPLRLEASVLGLIACSTGSRLRITTAFTPCTQARMPFLLKCARCSTG